MRHDMGRVVIERPRWGSHAKSPKIRQFGGRINEDGDYDGLTRLPSSREKIYGYAPKIQDKDFTDVLGPLRGYLNKNVGRPWDKVFSEATRCLKSGGWGVRHVFSIHLLGDVARDVILGEDGSLTSCSLSLIVCRYYVHPRTGLLCRTPGGRRRGR
jgi:hypothetical protein